MRTEREIKDNLKAVSAIGTITTTYQEISKKEMNRIRETALENRRFISELTRVYAAAKKAYFADKAERRSDKKERLIIMLSASSRFYGSLVMEIWREVGDYLDKNQADLAVIGEVGKRLVEKSRPDLKFSYFELTEDDPQEEEVKEVSDFISEYREVIVFHGKFRTILSQDVVGTDIAEEITEDVEKPDDYLFEPSPEAVLDFFENELKTAFFNQAVLEHRLSRHATRMVAMHKAGQNAEEREEDLEKERRKLRRRMRDKKQLEITSSFSLWE